MYDVNFYYIPTIAFDCFSDLITRLYDNRRQKVEIGSCGGSVELKFFLGQILTFLAENGETPKQM